MQPHIMPAYERWVTAEEFSRIPNDDYHYELVEGRAVRVGPSMAAERRDGQTVVVQSRGTELSFDPATITARAGETLTIRYENVGDMVHNLVIVRSDADVPIVGEAAFQAAFTNQWIPSAPEPRARVVAHTPLAGSKETVDVTFTVPPRGEYPFICTYASHWTVMRGRLIVNP